METYKFLASPISLNSHKIGYRKYRDFTDSLPDQYAAFWLTATSIDFSTDEMRTTGDAEIVLTASLAPCFALQAVTTGAYQLHRLDISIFRTRATR